MWEAEVLAGSVQVCLDFLIEGPHGSFSDKGPIFVRWGTLGRLGALVWEVFSG